LLGIYFWNTNIGEWELYNDTGVNTAYNQSGYEGYCWANAWHLTLITTGGDNELPSKVTGLSVTDVKDGKLNLAWNAATDNVAIDHYKIYRDGNFLINRTITSYQDTGLTNGHSYTYQISAVDTSGNEGAKSDPKSGIPTATSSSQGGNGYGYSGDITPPTAPTNVRCITPETDNTPTFSWAASTDSSGIEGYYVKIDSGSDTWAGNVTTWTSTNAVADGTHTFYVKARDASTNNNNGSYGSCSFTINTTSIGNPPVANAGGPYTGLTYQNIIFDGTGSNDIDGTIDNYTWDFGDGSFGYGIKPIHSYNAAGLFNITLTVTDNDGLSDSNTTTANILLDSDRDGLSDEIENILGSDPNNASDVISIVIDGKTDYLVDIDGDGTFDKFYDPSNGKNTTLKFESGKYLIDVNDNGKYDYIYNPAFGNVIVYAEEKYGAEEGLPIIFIAILMIVAVIIIIIAVLFKKGIIYIEKEQIEDEEKEKPK